MYSPNDEGKGSQEASVKLAADQAGATKQHFLLSNWLQTKHLLPKKLQTKQFLATGASTASAILAVIHSFAHLRLRQRVVPSTV